MKSQDNCRRGLLGQGVTTQCTQGAVSEVDASAGDTSKAYDQVNQLRTEISQANGKLQEIERRAG